MAKHEVQVTCWNYGHATRFVMDKRQEQSLARKISKSRAVCPSCKEEQNGNQPIFIDIGETLIERSKVYRCRHGHVTAISAFQNGMLHVCFGPAGEDFVNVQGTIEELKELIDSKEITCNHTREGGKLCDCKLKAVDNYELSYPCAPGIKTKTRVGDIWDKAGVDPVRPGTYDREGNYHGTKSENANRERLKRLRERNIERERMPGKRIDKATKRSYSYRTKDDVKPERLNGPK